MKWEEVIAPQDFSDVPIKNLNLEVISTSEELEDELSNKVKLVYFNGVGQTYTPGVYVGFNGKPINLFESKFFTPYWRTNTLILKVGMEHLYFPTGTSNLDVTNFFIHKTIIALNKQFNVVITPPFHYKRYSNMVEVIDNRDITHIEIIPPITPYTQDINVTCTWLQTKNAKTTSIANFNWSANKFYMLQLTITEYDINNDVFLTPITKNIVFETTNDEEADKINLNTKLSTELAIYPHLGFNYGHIGNGYSFFYIASSSVDIQITII